MHGFGRKGVGTVQGDQQLVAQAPKMGHHAVLFKALNHLNTHRIKVVRRDGIAPRADLMVPGNLFHTQQGRGLMVPWGVLQPALRLQQRR